MTSGDSSNSERAFERLLKPISAHQFFAEYFAKAPLILSRKQAEFYNDVVNLTDLDSFFSQQPSSDGLNVMDESNRIHPDKWTTESSAESPIGDVDLDRLWAQIRMGRSVRILSAQKSMPKLQHFCAAISRDLQFPVNANVYITPPSSTALDVHYDTHDVLVLQVSGAKRWRLYDMPIVRPGASQPFDRQAYEMVEPTRTFELSPGDLLYIPRGLVHQAESFDTTSVHVSVGLHYKVAHDLIAALAVKLQSEESFRQALPHGYSSAEERSEFLSDLGRLLGVMLPKIDLNDSLTEIQHNGFKSVEEIARPSFSQTLASPRLGNGAHLQKNTNANYSTEKEKDRIRLIANGDTIDIPILFEPLLDIILGDASFTLNDWNVLASLKTKQDLAKRLIESGFLEFVSESYEAN